jgi:hypothetical protein
MWWIKFLLLISITVGVTYLIIRIDSWIKTSRETHPEIFKTRGSFRALTYILLNLSDLLKL